MKSPLEIHLEKDLLSKLNGKVKEIAAFLFEDEEIQALQEYANTVSIKRLGFNDHGPVHMRKVANNAMTMFDILVKAGIKPSLVEEEVGDIEDSQISVLLASFLHDIGMTVGRENHENSSAILASPIIDRVLNTQYESVLKKTIIKTMVIEGILGHMAHQRVHSIEAGIILIADGCDMEKGRARIPMLINSKSRVGDIHKYSSSAVEHVNIENGDEKPLKITIEMSASVGFFQVEEVLIGKIEASSVKKYIELYAYVKGRDVKRYL